MILRLTNRFVLVGFLCYTRRGRQLRHGRVLALAQTREQHDPTVGKFKRVTVSVQIVFLHLAEPSRRFFDVHGRKDAKRRLIEGA